MQVVWALLQYAAGSGHIAQLEHSAAVKEVPSLQGDTRVSPCIIFERLSQMLSRAIPAAYIFNNSHCKHLQVFEQWYWIKCMQRCHIAQSLEHYKGAFNQGPLGLQSPCIMLYHWAIHPAAYTWFNNITANTCRLFEHCYNMHFCSESSVLVRDRCHFSLVFQKLWHRSRENTWLTPRKEQCSKHCNSHCKHVQVVWALLQSFCSESSVLSRSMSFFSSLSKIIQGDTRVRTRDLSDCRKMTSIHWATPDSAKIL